MTELFLIYFHLFNNVIFQTYFVSYLEIYLYYLFPFYSSRYSLFLNFECYHITQKWNKPPILLATKSKMIKTSWNENLTNSSMEKYFSNNLFHSLIYKKLYFDPEF